MDELILTLAVLGGAQEVGSLRPDPPLWLGCAVVSIGDLDGDGRGDLLASAPREQRGDEPGQGVVYALSGRTGDVLYTSRGPLAHGLTLAVLGDVDGDGLPDFAASSSEGVSVHSGVDGHGLYLLGGRSAPSDECVSAVPDVDGDGVTDLVVGSPSEAVHSTGSGAARVHSGVDGTLIRAFEGRQWEHLGYRVLGLPDLDGDGAGEIAYTKQVIAAAGYELELADPPARPPGECAEVVVASPRTGAVLFRVHCERWTPVSGTALASAGDVDGDGTPDLLTGWSSANGTGAAHEDGTPLPEPAGLAFLLSGKDGALLRRLGPADVSPMFGHALASGRDVDGDGFPDQVVTEYEDIWRDVERGRARVYSGREGQLLYTLVGGSWGMYGASAAWLDDVDGDRVPDLAIGSMIDYVGSYEPGSVTAHSGACGEFLWRFPN